MPFITQQEAIDNVTGFASKPSDEQARLLSQSEAYLIARNVKPYDDAADCPIQLKLASYEVIKGTMAGVLYAGQDQQLKRKKVKADTVESEKEFMDGSVALNAYEQYINDLIYPYAKRQSLMWLKKV